MFLQELETNAAQAAFQLNSFQLKLPTPWLSFSFLTGLEKYSERIECDGNIADLLTVIIQYAA